MKAQATVLWEAYINSVPNPQDLQATLDTLIEQDYYIDAVIPTTSYQKVGGAAIYVTKAVIVVSK